MKWNSGRLLEALGLINRNRGLFFPPGSRGAPGLFGEAVKEIDFVGELRPNARQESCQAWPDLKHDTVFAGPQLAEQVFRRTA